jgi:hypothetical protein
MRAWQVPALAQAQCEGHHRIKLSHNPEQWCSLRTVKGTILLIAGDITGAAMYTVIQMATVRSGPSLSSNEVGKLLVGTRVCRPPRLFPLDEQRCWLK